MRKILFLSISLFFTQILIASTLNLALGANPSRINPLLATDSASGEISGWIFNGLVKFDKNGKIVPDLALSYKFKDPKTLIFSLKHNIQWQDGKPFSAKDVAFTYKLLKSPKIFTPYSSDFRYVDNVKVIDPYTIEVHYKEPYYKAVSIWMMGILPYHIWDKVDNPMTSDFNSHPIGTGPYRLLSMQTSGDAILKANKRYHPHPPHIKKIYYHFMPDPTTQFLMLKAHKLDYGSLSPLQLQRQISKHFLNYYRIIQMPGHGYTYLGFNLRKPPFSDIRVRRAINMAINKKELIDILFFGHAKICHGPFMPGTFAYPKHKLRDIYDPKRARMLLKNAGFTEKHPLKFTISTNANNPTRLYAAQIIQHQLAAVGVYVKIRTMEWQAFLNTVVTPRHFDAILLGWSLGLIPDAYALWDSDADKIGGFNLVGYHNKKVDMMIIKAERSTNIKEVGIIYRKMFDIIAGDLPYIFLYIPDSILAINRKITPVVPSIIGITHNQIDWIKP